MFLNTEKFTRFGIADELKNRIVNAVIFWQKKHIKQLLKQTVKKHLDQTYQRIQEELHEIKQEMMGKGFSVTPRTFGAIASSFGTGTTAIAAFGVLISTHVVFAVVVLSVGLAGALVFGALIVTQVTKNFETIREDAFNAIIDPLSKEELERKMREYYEEKLTTEIQAVIEVLKKEIDHFKTSLNNMQHELDHYRNKTDELCSISREIYHFREKIASVERLYEWDMSEATEWTL